MAVGMLETMGRKKTKKPDTDGGAVVVRGSKKWYEWVGRLAKNRRLKITDMVDQALVEYAKAHGFEEPPPDR